MAFLTTLIIYLRQVLLEEKETAERKVKEVSELVESQAANFDRTRQGKLQNLFQHLPVHFQPCKNTDYLLIFIDKSYTFVAMMDRLHELQEGMNTKQEVINKLMRAQERDEEASRSSSAPCQEEVAALEQECRDLRGQLRTLLLASPGIHLQPHVYIHTYIHTYKSAY